MQSTYIPSQRAERSQECWDMGHVCFKRSLSNWISEANSLCVCVRCERERARAREQKREREEERWGKKEREREAMSLECVHTLFPSSILIYNRGLGSLYFWCQRLVSSFWFSAVDRLYAAGNHLKLKRLLLWTEELCFRLTNAQAKLHEFAVQFTLLHLSSGGSPETCRDNRQEKTAIRGTLLTIHKKKLISAQVHTNPSYTSTLQTRRKRERLFEDQHDGWIRHCNKIPLWNCWALLSCHQNT